MVQYACYDSPFGTICIGYEDDSVTAIRRADCDFVHDPSPVSDLANMQLQEYFRGARRSFDFPCKPEGTPFQLAVWEALRGIPYGETQPTDKLPPPSESREPPAPSAWPATAIPCGL